MASIVYTVILIVSMVFLVWKNEDEESNFPIKLMGYFLLGSFTFNLNQIFLPLGFIVYLIFFRPKLNIMVKRMSAIFGFLAFICVQWIIPFVIDEWKSRPISIEHEIGSVYTMNFQQENERVMQELNLVNNTVRLEDFKVDYTEDGRITELSWKLLRQHDDSYNLYEIQYDIANKRYQVNNSELETWLQYNQLIDAEHFFEILNVLDIKDITHAKGDFSTYVIQSTGERINYGGEDRIHIISDGEMKLIDNEQLPVEGYYISTYAMKKTGEKRNDQGNITQENFESAETSDYFFDVDLSEK
ncbi:hypothetical protein [Peribacillus muralis]|uniref:hypothetical protein n=1 Tax=Peribacillus muralis TaxID=264697 RepID=UPI00366BAF62